MEYTTDVLVIGGGGAACRAALAAADAGARVLLASKRPPAKAGATSYPVAEMAGYNAGDPAVCGDVEKHYSDILEAGQGMADPQLAAKFPAHPCDPRPWGADHPRHDAPDRASEPDHDPG